MITGLRDVYYNVRDMDKAVQFYEKAFGMKKIFGNPHWTSLSLGQVTVGLHWTEGEEVPHVPRDAHGAHAGATITLHSTNVTEDKMQIVAAGAKVLGEFDESWGHMLVFEDLDGNVLKLMNPK